MTKRELIEKLGDLPDNTIITISHEDRVYFVADGMNDLSVDEDVYAPEFVLFTED